MPLYVFRKLCPAVLDSSGKAVNTFDADWTTLTAYGGSKDHTVWVKNNQMLLEQPEVEISLSHCRCYRPNTAGIEDSKTYGDLCETPHGVH